MRVPPPGFENALRPSSAVRALSAPAEQRDEIVDGLRLEHRRVEPGRDRLRIPARHGLLRGHATDRCRIDGTPVARAAAGPSAAGAVRRTRGDREVCVGRAVIGEQPVARRDGDRARVGFEESRR